MTAQQAQNSAANETALRLGVGGRPKRRLLRLILAIIVIAGLTAAGVLIWRMRTQAQNQVQFETAKAFRGNLKTAVTATGTIESVGAVEVGAEISGRVDEVLVRFNDSVKKGDVLAKINPEQLVAKLKQGTAQSMVSAAGLESARAAYEEAQTKAARTKTLADKGLVSTQDLDSALAAEKKAKAALATAQAQQAVSAASLDEARTNLSKATIRSPVDGVVLARSIEPGQTVASSLQAPVLFLVAQDLTTMKLKVNIDEADVGSVREGHEASFTVDAYPKKQFPSVVKSIKNVPTSGKDIVTYEAELTASNAERLLRPGMTATATIITESRSSVLLVPNAALRFTPPNAQPTASAQRSTGLALPGMPKTPGMGRGSGSSGSAPRKAEGGARVWVIKNGQPSPIRLSVGLSDGTNTEIAGGELKEDTDVLIDVVVGSK